MRLFNFLFNTIFTLIVLHTFLSSFYVSILPMSTTLKSLLFHKKLYFLFSTYHLFFNILLLNKVFLTLTFIYIATLFCFSFFRFLVNQYTFVFLIKILLILFILFFMHVLFLIED